MLFAFTILSILCFWDASIQAANIFDMFFLTTGSPLTLILSNSITVNLYSSKLFSKSRSVLLSNSLAISMFFSLMALSYKHYWIKLLRLSLFASETFIFTFSISISCRYMQFRASPHISSSCVNSTFFISKLLIYVQFSKNLLISLQANLTLSWAWVWVAWVWVAWVLGSPKPPLKIPLSMLTHLSVAHPYNANLRLFAFLMSI